MGANDRNQRNSGAPPDPAADPSGLDTEAARVAAADAEASRLAELEKARVVAEVAAQSAEAKALADKPSGYRVAQGLSVMTVRGIIDQGAVITARDFVHHVKDEAEGKKNLDDLVNRGAVVDLSAPAKS